MAKLNPNNELVRHRPINVNENSIILPHHRSDEQEKGKGLLVNRKLGNRYFEGGQSHLDSTRIEITTQPNFQVFAKRRFYCRRHRPISPLAAARCDKPFALSLNTKNILGGQPQGDRPNQLFLK